MSGHPTGEEVECKEYCEKALAKSHQCLHLLTQAQEQTTDLEIGLDRWHSGKELASMNVLEGVDLEEQEYLVQEFVALSTLFANLQIFSERVELQVHRNFRQVKKAEVVQLMKNSQNLKAELKQQVNSTISMAKKVDQ